MSQTLSPSLARCYGMARVARVWKISRASVYRSLKETPPNTIARRPGPVGACSDAELAEHIRQHIAASRLHGEGYRKLWARLRFAGVRASPRMCLRHLPDEEEGRLDAFVIEDVENAACVRRLSPSDLRTTLPDLRRSRFGAEIIPTVGRSGSVTGNPSGMGLARRFRFSRMRRA